MLIKVVMLLIFFTFTAGVGIYCQKKVLSTGDFVLGGRGVGPWLTAFSYGTSYFSAVVFIGYAGQFGWNFGLSATWIGIGNALIGSLLAWFCLGNRTRVMTKSFESATMPDFFAKRYNCPVLKIVSSVIIFVFLVPYSASVYKGLSGLFAMAFNIDFKYCIITIACLTGVYVILGGYLAAALNDLIQGIIMLVGIVVVIFAVLNANGGFSESVAMLSGMTSEIAPNVDGVLTSMWGADPVTLIGVLILTSLGTWGLPQMVHKFYTIKDKQALKIGSVISTVFALFVAGGSYFMGGFGRLFYTPSENGVVYDDVVPKMLDECLPDFLIGIVLILVLSASMSTLSSLVIASSSTFTLDFLKGIFFKSMKAKQELWIIKILCAVFVIISVVIAINPNNLITTLMSLSWGTLAGAFLGPFLYGLFWKVTTIASVWASFAVAVIINATNLLCGITAPTTAGAFSILVSLAIVPLVSLVTPKLDKSFVDKAFKCFDK